MRTRELLAVVLISILTDQFAGATETDEKVDVQSPSSEKLEDAVARFNEYVQGCKDPFRGGIPDPKMTVGTYGNVRLTHLSIHEYTQEAEWKNLDFFPRFVDRSAVKLYRGGLCDWTIELSCKINRQCYDDDFQTLLYYLSGEVSLRIRKATPLTMQFTFNTSEPSFAAQPAEDVRALFEEILAVSETVWQEEMAERGLKGK